MRASIECRLFLTFCQYHLQLTLLLSFQFRWISDLITTQKFPKTILCVCGVYGSSLTVSHMVSIYASTLVI